MSTLTPQTAAKLWCAVPMLILLAGAAAPSSRSRVAVGCSSNEAEAAANTSNIQTHNLQAMAARPSDLCEGRPLSAAPAGPQLRAVEQWMRGSPKAGTQVEMQSGMTPALSVQTTPMP